MKNELNRALVAKKSNLIGVWKYAAVLLCMLILGIGNAWANHSTHYGKAVLNNATGNGTVYLSTALDSNSGQTGSSTPGAKDGTSYITWNCGGESGSDSKTYYARGTANNGYYYSGYATSSTATTYTAATTGKSFSASSTTQGSPTETKIYGFFLEVTIENPADIIINATDNSSTSSANTGNIVFTTKGDAVADFTAASPIVTKTAGYGTFTQTGFTVATNGNATVGYKFVGDGTYGGNVAVDSRTRTNSATYTITSLPGNNSGTCTVTYTFPNIVIDKGSFDHMTTINTVSKSATATFPVQWADDKLDFSASFGTVTGGGEWTIDNITYTATDATSGTISIDYTFDPNGAIGNHTAALTLAANDNAGGASRTLTLTAEAEKLAENDAVVISGSSETEYETLAEAITAANALTTNPTVKILRNVEGLTSTLEITKPMTIDLNSFTVSGTLTSSVNKLFYINTATAALTINDSRNGGKIAANGNASAALSTILVDEGALVLTKGDIEIENTNTGASASAKAVKIANGARFGMAGGGLIATTAGTGAYGLETTTNPTVTEMVGVTGGTITATAATTAVGINCLSSSATVSGDPTNANVALSGVTVNATAIGTTAYAVQSAPGVILGINSGTYNATAKDTAYTLNTSGYTAIVNGMFNATANIKIARAVNVAAGITAVRNGAFNAIAATEKAHTCYAASGAKLLTYGGTFHGTLENAAANQYATGAYIDGTLEAQGGTFIGEVAKSGLAAAQTNYAVGVYANTGANVTLANATLRGLTSSAFVNGAYALYTKTANPVNLTSCTLEAISTQSYARGVYIKDGATPLTMNNCTVNSTAATTYAYGIHQDNATSMVDVTGSTFNITSNGTYAYGAYVANGTSFNATDCGFTVRTLQTSAATAENSLLRGIYVATGKKANLTGCTFNVSGNATYSNNGYGLYIDGSADVTDCDVTVSNINNGAYAIYNSANTGLVNVYSGKFKATAAAGTIVETNATAAAAKQQFYGGYYVHNTNLAKYLPEGYIIETLTTGTEFSAGYKYHIRPTTVVPDPVCKIGSIGYATLEEALEFVNKNSGTAYTIYMVKDYTLPAGDYTLPSKATLLVPYKTGTGAGATTAIGTKPDRVTTYTQPECFRRLVLADGVNLIVNGTIEASAQMACTGQGNGKNGYTTGGYGLLQLLEGSKIVLNNDAKLIVWGFVAGERVSTASYKRGSIEAKRGAKIYQGFQIGDWKGGSAVLYGSLLTNAKNLKAFPVNQYFVMNIEVPILYRPGAEQYGATGVDVSGVRKADEVPIVGVPKPNDLTHQALFLLEDVDVSEDTWIIEEYDPLTDRWIFTMNSSAKIGSLNVNVEGYEINSKDYILPITHCMKLHILSGDLTITQSTVFLPGVELEIDKEAEVIVNSGQTLYFVDQDSWGKIAGHAGDAYYQVPWYSPAWKIQGTGGAIPTGITQTNCPRYVAAVASRPALPDALLNLHGKITVNGALHTSDGGANIFSSNEDAGTINFVFAASGNGNLYFFWKLTGSGISTKCVFTNNSEWPNSTVTTSAKLKNGDDTYEETAGTVAGKTWIYINGHWQCWTPDGCLTRDAFNYPYAHPSDYVRLSSDEPDANHVYKAYSSDRYFIWDEDCQWWEIDPSLIEGGEYKAIKADRNGKYNYYEYSASAGCWIIKKVTITWMNESTTLDTYSNVGYNTHPKYLSAAPTKASTTTDYYTWLGWTKGSTEGEFFAKDAELPVATENTTYYAYFKEDKFTFRATFNNYDGSLLETKLVAVGEEPVYEGETPQKPASTSKEYTFTGWNPTLGAISNAPVTYTAQFNETDRLYTVQWVNYNGTVLKEEQVTYNTTPTAPTVDPTRPNDDYYTYTFAAWSPAISAVTGNQTYTATYNYEMKVTKHTVVFKNGSETVYTQNLVENSVPVFDGTTPTKTADAQYTYTFDGWSTTEGGALAYATDVALPALTGNVTYYAHFKTTTNTYDVYWRSEDGKVLYEMDTNVRYGDPLEFNGATPTKNRMGATAYSFDGWSSTIGGDKIASLTVTGNATYYAYFLPVYTVTFNTNGHGTAPAKQEIKINQKVSEPAVPTAEDRVFGGWYKEEACIRTWNFETDVVTGSTTLYAQWTPAVASVTAGDGTTYYTTVASAIEAANSKTNPTVTMLQNASVASQVEITAAMTIDLNGKTVNSTLASNTAVFKIVTSGKDAVVTILDNSTDKNGKIDHTANFENYLYGVWLNKGTLNFEGGAISANNTNTTSNARAYGIYADGTYSVSALNISGGTINASGYTATMGIIFNNTCPLTMTGGTITVTGYNAARGIYVNGGTTNLTGATIISTTTSTNNYAIFANAGTLTINSGTYTAKGTGTVYTILEKAGTVTINGGKFSGTNKVLEKTGGNATVKGGVYTSNLDLKDNCAPNYHVLPLTGADPYRYEVAQAYTVTFNNYDGTTLQSSIVKKGVTPAYTGETPTKEADAQYTYSHLGWTPAIVAVTGDATYTATFGKTINAYTVTFLNDDNSVLASSELNYGSMPAYTGTPVSAIDAGYIFEGWTPELTTVTGTATYKAIYRRISVAPIIVDANAEETIAINTTTETTIVRVQGTLDVAENATLTTDVLILEASSATQTEPASSGEIVGEGTVTAVRAFFKFTQPGGFKARRWYSVAVPWQVDVPWNNGYTLTGGISAKKNAETFRPLALGRDIDLIYYDGAERAQNGHSDNCWKYVEDDGQSEAMQPGKAYMFFLAQDADTLLFTRKEGAELHTNVTTVMAYEEHTDNMDKDANWNGIANPATYKAYLNAGTTVGYIYVPETDRYVTIDLDQEEGKLMVGQAVYVQAAIDEGTSMVVNANRRSFEESPLSAPSRTMAASGRVRYDVTIAHNGEASDRVIIRSEENKPDTYTIAKDLVKFGVSAQVAQIWVNRYNGQLAMNTMPLEDNTAVYPLGIRIPQAGEYTIACNQQAPNGYLLYLTYEGHPIWNLSEAPYTTDMVKGTNDRYGLKLMRSNAPTMPTALEEMIPDSHGETRKVVMDGHVYIIRNGEVYTIGGKKVTLKQ